MSLISVLGKIFKQIIKFFCECLDRESTIKKRQQIIQQTIHIFFSYSLIIHVNAVDTTLRSWYTVARHCTLYLDLSALWEDNGAREEIVFTPFISWIRL